MLLNADDWKNPHDCWSEISFFIPLKFLILNDSILMDLRMGCRNFTFKHFTKERKKSLEFSSLNNTFFMFDHCWNGRKFFINICYLHYFPYSFHPILALDEAMTEVISFGIRRSFLIIFLFLSNIL